MVQARGQNDRTSELVTEARSAQTKQKQKGSQFAAHSPIGLVWIYVKQV
jgi:hypothetical protein